MNEKITKIHQILCELYPSECSLEFNGEPYKLLVMTRLSAQCTDARVNSVCKKLFSEFPTIEALADAPIEDIEHIVLPCGVYRMKSRNIKDACRELLDKHGGVVPSSIEELIKLPGVGRKTANLIVSEIYGLPGVVADTHCIRLSNRLGIADSKNPSVVETELKAQLDPEIQADFCHRLVFHGRAVCKARSPKCGDCLLFDWCDRNI